jgi:branched-chain amino acid transport system permease protein
LAQATHSPTPATERDWQEQALKFIPIAITLILVVLFLIWAQGQLAGKSPSRMVNTTITGLLVGGVYALVAVGIVIINKASGVFNFAHGGMMYASALIFWSFFSVADIRWYAALGIAVATTILALTTNSWRDILDVRRAIMGLIAVAILTFLMMVGGEELRYLRAIAGGVTGAVLLGLVIERFAIRPLMNQPLFTVVLMTLAIDRVLTGVTQMVWGPIERPLTIFNGIETLGLEPVYRWDASETFLTGQVRISTELAIVFVLALIAFAVFVLFFRSTNVGLAMRAAAEHQQLAQAVGLRVRLILAVAWAIAAVLAMTAGVLFGGVNSVDKGMPGLALNAFPAVLLGGLESVGGALVGGLVIGLVQEWANFLYPGAEAGTRLAPYLILMIVLMIRPDGLFGQKRIERI